MTLVVSCISPNHVVQVSDRRLTWAAGPKAGELADDHTNKALVVCNRLCVSYTGLAEIGRVKTDEWVLDVADRVRPYNPARVWIAIALAATAEFRNIRFDRSLKRHAFLISGWAKLGRTDAPISPFISTISNALSAEGDWLDEAEDSFRVRVIPLADKPYLISTVGQRLPDNILTRLTRNVRNYAVRERGPEAYMRLIAAAIRATANINQLVGRNLMAISLPKTGLNRSAGLSIPLSFPMQTDEALALYLPYPVRSPVLYAPNYTCNGMSMTHISFSAVPE